MNWKTFGAMLARDAHVARRNAATMAVQTLLQPILLTFVFGQVMTSSGVMPTSYKNILLPGLIGMSMILTGIQAVAMPLIAEFQFTKEIEDRLLAPMKIEWLAIEKVFAGMLQSLVAGLIVLPASWLLMGSGVNLHVGQPLIFIVVIMLIALFAASGGLALGCSVGQTQVGLMFSLVLAPMISFGCVYYPWAYLKSFPVVQKIVLINPLVYASEGLRGSMAPQFPHIELPVVIAVLALANALCLYAGLKKFYQKAVS